MTKSKFLQELDYAKQRQARQNAARVTDAIERLQELIKDESVIEKLKEIEAAYGITAIAV